MASSFSLTLPMVSNLTGGRLHFQGVYALAPEAEGSARLRLIADDFEKPNGLAFSPDERILYVCDTARYHVRAFEVEVSGQPRIGSGRVFVRLDPGQPGGPDGIKVDREGRVYVAVALGIWVFEPDGRLLGILETPKRPSNLAWCGPDARGLAITAVDAVYHVRLTVPGILPPLTPAVLPLDRLIRDSSLIPASFRMISSLFMMPQTG